MPGNYKSMIIIIIHILINRVYEFIAIVLKKDDFPIIKIVCRYYIIMCESL